MTKEESKRIVDAILAMAVCDWKANEIAKFLNVNEEAVNEVLSHATISHF